MCKLNFTKVRLPVSVCFSAMMGLLTFLLPTQNAPAQGCAPSIACGVTMNPNSGTKVVIGQVLTIQHVNAGIIGTSCIVSNGATWLAYPDGTNVSQIMNGFQL